LQARERAGETARLTATSTLAVDDLPDELELSGEGSVSATQRQGPAGERESAERANGQEERLPEGVSSFILTG
jgi:hypothetical protein